MLDFTVREALSDLLSKLNQHGIDNNLDIGETIAVSFPGSFLGVNCKVTIAVKYGVDDD